jgi:phosphopantothenoylcysteine decarboxylase/phosphopantothenate--cysteine ligase
MKILISAGPTRERIDAVRFLSNRSSGKMGYALARAARQAGLETTLVSGPVSLSVPEGVRLISVESAAEMAEAIHAEAGNADIVIMAAAVADYRPVKTVANKMKKQSGNLVLELERTEDILKSLGQKKKAGHILVGFAAETDDVIAYAKSKLDKKNLDWIVANDVSRADRGFASDQNAVTMISRNGKQIDIPLADKDEVACKILEVIKAHI